MKKEGPKKKKIRFQHALEPLFAAICAARSKTKMIKQRFKKVKKKQIKLAFIPLRAKQVGR